MLKNNNAYFWRKLYIEDKLLVNYVCSNELNEIELEKRRLFETETRQKLMEEELEKQRLEQEAIELANAQNAEKENFSENNTNSETPDNEPTINAENADNQINLDEKQESEAQLSEKNENSNEETNTQDEIKPTTEEIVEEEPKPTIEEIVEGRLKILLKEYDEVVFNKTFYQAMVEHLHLIKNLNFEEKLKTLFEQNDIYLKKITSKTYDFKLAVFDKLQQPFSKIKDKILIFTNSNEVYSFQKKIYFVYFFKEMTRIFKRRRFIKKKFKKKKIRKLRLFKRIRKLIKRKMYKSKMRFFRKNFPTHFKKIKIKKLPNLIKKMTLSPKLIDQANVEFFYKLNKNYKENFSETKIFLSKGLLYPNLAESFTMFLRNFHKKPYKKLRIARVTHWKMFYNKTIRKQRYKGFINFYIKKYDQYLKNYVYFFNYFTLCKFSWSRMNKIQNFLKDCLLSIINRNIISLPLLSHSYMKWKKISKKIYYSKKKIARWSYLNFKRAICPWLQRRKKAPKITQHVQPTLLHLKNLCYQDPLTNYLYIPKKFYYLPIPPVEEFKTNFFLKLHMFRYKANKKCMLPFCLTNCKLLELKKIIINP